MVVALVCVCNDSDWRQREHERSPLFPRRLLSPPPPMLRTTRNSRARTSACRRSSTSGSGSATSCANACGRCSTRRKRDAASRRRAHHPANRRTPVNRHPKLADRNPGGSKRPVATSLVDAGGGFDLSRGSPPRRIQNRSGLLSKLCLASLAV